MYCTIEFTADNWRNIIIASYPRDYCDANAVEYNNYYTVGNITYYAYVCEHKKNSCI